MGIQTTIYILKKHSRLGGIRANASNQISSFWPLPTSPKGRRTASKPVFWAETPLLWRGWGRAVQCWGKWPTPVSRPHQLAGSTHTLRINELYEGGIPLSGIKARLTGTVRGERGSTEQPWGLGEALARKGLIFCSKYFGAFALRRY